MPYELPPLSKKYLRGEATFEDSLARPPNFYADKDVLYVEELNGPNTVNTMPLKTLESFREHGNVRLSIEDRLQEAKAHLAALAEIGISYDQVTRQLQEEGVQKFIDSFQKLFACIDNKRKVLQS